MLIISPKVRAKLISKHDVTEREIEEAFANRDKGFLYDTREDNQTDPQTEWFVSQTDYGKDIKVCFVRKNGDIFIKTAYVPSQIEIDIYNKHA